MRHAKTRVLQFRRPVLLLLHTTYYYYYYCYYYYYILLLLLLLRLRRRRPLLLLLLLLGRTPAGGLVLWSDCSLQIGAPPRCFGLLRKMECTKKGRLAASSDESTGSAEEIVHNS